MKRLFWLLFISAVSETVAAQAPLCHASFCYSLVDSMGVYHATFYNTSTVSLPTDSIVQSVWDYGDGNTYIFSPTGTVYHVYATQGVYTVTLSIQTAGNCTSTSSATLNMSQPTYSCVGSCNASYCYSVVDSMGLHVATFYNTSTAGISSDSIVKSFWDFSDGAPLDSIHSVNSPVHHVYTSVGAFDVHLSIRTANNCYSTANSNPVLVSNQPINTCITTRIQEVNNSTFIEVYPTLIRTTATITYNNSSGTATLLLYDVAGRKVKEQRLNSGRSTLNRNGLRSGIYFYAIVVKDKLVKKGKLIFD